MLLVHVILWMAIALNVASLFFSLVNYKRKENVISDLIAVNDWLKQKNYELRQEVIHTQAAMELYRSKTQ